MNVSKELLDLFQATASGGEQGGDHKQALASLLEDVVNTEVKRDSLARLIFQVEELERGANAIYYLETEEKIPVIRMPFHGTVPEFHIAYKEVHLSTYPLATRVSWKKQIARDARFNVLQKQIDKIRNGFVKKENADALAVVGAAIDSNNTVGGASGFASLDLVAFNTAVAELESKEGRMADLLVVSPRRAADFRTWAKDKMADVKFNEVQTRGYIGDLWGIRIISSFELADTEAYLFDTSRFGVMPVRQKVEIDSDPTVAPNLEIGYIADEEVGFAALDKDAVVKLVFAS